jgi:membrane fusion protein, peptide pheromone/bacteriocin exporter
LKLAAMQTPEPLHHVARAKDTLEQLQAERGPVRHWIYWLLWIFLGTALLLLPIAEVDVTVNGLGRLRPEGELGEVRTAMGGPLEKVFVRENQLVKRGEPLMELAAPALRRQREHLSERQENLAALREDVGALLALDDPDARKWRTGVWAMTAVRHRSLMRQHDQTVAQRESELQRVETLYARGLVARQDFERTLAALEAAKGDREMASQEAIARWQAEKLRLDGEWNQATAERDQLDSQLALHRILAPVKGEVMGVETLRPGQVVPAGEIVAVISPVGRLRVDARIGSEAVGFLREGMRARVQVDAFPHTEWGVLEGTVEAIAPDVTDASQRPHRILIRLETENLRRNDGTVATVMKGMSAQVRFLVTRRTLWQLLVQDAADWLSTKEEEPPV